jgi:hypothetical protein
MTDKISLYQVPVPSTDFSREAMLYGNQIVYYYWRDEVEYKSGLRFNRIRASRLLSEPFCTAWHITDAYDTLVEVNHSPWINEFDRKCHKEEWALHHYLIYLDSAGSFEFIAKDWELLPEEIVA